MYALIKFIADCKDNTQCEKFEVVDISEFSNDIEKVKASIAKAIKKDIADGVESYYFGNETESGEISLENLSLENFQVRELSLEEEVMMRRLFDIEDGDFSGGEFSFGDGPWFDPLLNPEDSSGFQELLESVDSLPDF
jgi:hypothetical protein